MTTNQPIQNKSRQTFVGVIVSDNMKDTAVVSIKRYEKHPKYKKFISRNSKLMAHNPGNLKKMGDTVTIEACRPLSKNKSFRIVS